MMEVFLENSAPVLEALGTTLYLLVACSIGALALGVLVTIARVSPIPPLQKAAFCYVQFFLNVPLLALLLLAVFALPDAGVIMPLLTTVIIVLALYEAAYVAEAVRSGVNTVAPEQMEAARALGLALPQVLRYVVIPQAMRAVVQPLGNVFIMLLMNTALAATVGVVEVTSVTNKINQVVAQPILIYALSGLVYMGLALGIAYVARRIEKKVAILR